MYRLSRIEPLYKSLHTYFAADSEGVLFAVKVDVATVDVLEDKEDISEESRL